MKRSKAGLVLMTGLFALFTIATLFSVGIVYAVGTLALALATIVTLTESP